MKRLRSTQTYCILLQTVDDKNVLMAGAVSFEAIMLIQKLSWFLDPLNSPGFLETGISLYSLQNWLI